jgi:hypothetical protein
MAFWRRKKGRHALGAAVTSIPAAPPAPVAAAGPRVELTFRDGTSAALDGMQAKALNELAEALTRRD